MLPFESMTTTRFLSVLPLLFVTLSAVGASSKETSGYVTDRIGSNFWVKPQAAWRTKSLPFSRCYAYPERIVVLEDDPGNARNKMILCPAAKKAGSSACDCDKAPSRAVRNMESGWLLGIEKGKLFWNAGDSDTAGKLMIFDLATGQKLFESPWRGEGFERVGTTLVDRQHRLSDEDLARLPVKPECRELTEEETIQINYQQRIVTTMVLDLKTMKAKTDEPRCEVILEQ